MATWGLLVAVGDCQTSAFAVTDEIDVWSTYRLILPNCDDCLRYSPSVIVGCERVVRCSMCVVVVVARWWLCGQEMAGKGCSSHHRYHPSTITTRFANIRHQMPAWAFDVWCLRLWINKNVGHASIVTCYRCNFDVCSDCQRLPQHEINRRSKALLLVAFMVDSDPLTAAARGARYNGRRPNYHVEFPLVIILMPPTTAGPLRGAVKVEELNALRRTLMLMES